MELLVAAAIGTLTAGGVYLILRLRSFPVILGLSLLSYAVNLFIFSAGRLAPGKTPIIAKGVTDYTDPLPQALVLTAIVIGFATSAMFLVVLLASRGLSDTDHVDGEEPDDGTAHVSIASAAASPPGEADEGRRS